MAIRIRNSDNIKGIKIVGTDKSIKIAAQLADNTTLFFKSKKDILKAIDLVEQFGNLSGLELNKETTYAMDWMQ